MYKTCNNKKCYYFIVQSRFRRDIVMFCMKLLKAIYITNVSHNVVQNIC